MPPTDWARQTLAFWFDEHGESDWFGGGPEFDAKVTDRLAGWRDALRSQPADMFLDHADTALAAIILFDQVPRNSFRGTAEAFATDHVALAVAKAAVERGLDAGLSKDQKLFLYLPFEHSESNADQRESVRLFSSLGDQHLLQFALDHQAMIERFGRFPHRNKALGRADRAGEAEAVAEGHRW
ncbi:MAG: DUF924 domain-containing protein [Sphingomonadaceae bacterium]|nr:DUF924 domain-containing protein [Sphingomonadaceae bacterium]